jgi:hypothetical protein
MSWTPRETEADPQPRIRLNLNNKRSKETARPNPLALFLCCLAPSPLQPVALEGHETTPHRVASKAKVRNDCYKHVSLST